METNATTPTATQTSMPPVVTDGAPPDIEKDDIIRRNIQRELPCKLTDEEFVRISRERVAKEAERDELVEELARETKKRKEQIESYNDEIKKKGREIHTGYQDRTVKCIDVFKKGVDGVGYVHTLRTDSWSEVERRPATAHETQRHLKVVDDQPNGGILDEARKRQRSAAVPEVSDVPTEAAPAESKTTEGDATTPDADGDEKKSKRGKKAES